jgi:hypothetical protein
MDSTHIRWLEEHLERNTVQNILKAEKGRIGKRRREHDRKEEPNTAMWFQTGGALTFMTAAPHCGDILV